MSVKTEGGIDFLLKTVETEGIACSTVSDGHLLVFTKKRLEAIIAAIDAKGTDRAIVFVKRPDFKD